VSPVLTSYDPSKITYGQLLRVFFSVAHDPTQLNRQGPDEGTQYRSSIFYGSDEQKLAFTSLLTIACANSFSRFVSLASIALSERQSAARSRND
jgi:peptide-methionine (S)-S-oxide reductase